MPHQAQAEVRKLPGKAWQRPRCRDAAVAVVVWFYIQTETHSLPPENRPYQKDWLFFIFQPSIFRGHVFFSRICIFTCISIDSTILNV